MRLLPQLGRNAARLLILALAVMAFVLITAPAAQACSQDEPDIDDPAGSVSMDQLSGEEQPSPFYQIPDNGSIVVVSRQTIAVTTPTWNYYQAGVRANLRAWGPRSDTASSELRFDGSGKVYRVDENDDDYCFFGGDVVPMEEPRYLVLSDGEDPLYVRDATDDVLTAFFGPSVEIDVDDDEATRMIGVLEDARPWYLRRAVKGNYGLFALGLTMLLSGVLMRGKPRQRSEVA